MLILSPKLLHCASLVKHSTMHYTLAKQARTLGANKLAKQLFDKLQSLRIPPRFQEQVEIATISSRARPYSDPEELLPMCYRCSTYNPLAANSKTCVNCGQKFVYSFVSFGWYTKIKPGEPFIFFNVISEILPLVEFELEEGIGDTEAVRLIETPPTNKSVNGGSDGWKQEVNDTQEVLKLDVDFEEFEDPFTSKLISVDVIFIRSNG